MQVQNIIKVLTEHMSICDDLEVAKEDMIQYAIGKTIVKMVTRWQRKSVS